MTGTLKMDVSAAMAVSSKMTNSSEEIYNQWRLINQRIDEFVQLDWKGRSSDQFKDIFKQLLEYEYLRLQELKDLTIKLDEEITQWQEIGSGLGA